MRAARSRRAPAKLEDEEERPQHEAAAAASPSLKVTLRKPSSGAPPSEEARLPPRAARLRRAEALSTKSTKLTFRAGAKRKGEGAAAATRITIKVPKKAGKPKPKPRAKAKPKIKPKFDLMDLLEEQEPEGPPPPRNTAERMQRVMEAVLEATDSKGRRRAAVFQTLPSPEELPVYYEIVAEPMDLDRVQARLVAAPGVAGGYGERWTPFKEDMLLVFNNARLFNADGTVIFGPQILHILHVLLYRFSSVCCWQMTRMSLRSCSTTRWASSRTRRRGKRPPPRRADPPASTSTRAISAAIPATPGSQLNKLG